MSISIGPDIVIGRRGISLSGGGAAVDWWLSGGISAANAIAVYQPIGAASLAASYVNLANPGTYDAAPGVAPTFAAATGWTFNGSTQYLDSGVVPAAGYTMIFRYSSTAGTNRGFIGSYDGGSTYFDIAATTAGGCYFNYGDKSSTATQVPDSGVSTVTSKTSGVLALAGPIGYYNGSAVVTLAATWSGTSTRNMWIGADNRSTPFFGTGTFQAVAIYNTTLTADQVAAVSTAMAAL